MKVALEILGVTLEGPPPVGVVHLRFEPVLKALYGLNGAGKTAILEGVRAALTGAAPRTGNSHLHVRVVAPASADFDSLEGQAGLSVSLEQLYESLEDEVEFADLQIRGGRMFEPETRAVWLGAAVSEESWDTARMQAGPPSTATYAYLLSWLKFNRDGELARAVAAQGFFTLTAIGEAGSPGWRVAVSARMDEQPLAARKAELIPRDVTWRESHPAWVPLPIVSCGKLTSPMFMNVVDEAATPADADSILVDFLSGFWAPLIVARGGDVVVSPEVEDFLLSVSRNVSEDLAQLLEDAPVLRCDLSPPGGEWLKPGAVRWLAYDAPTMTWVPLAQLSEAQRRWTLIGIRTSLLAYSDDIGLEIGCIVIDEPEAALHPRAQRHAIAGLQELSRRLACPVLVATHSPVLINHPDVSLHHVFRGASGHTEVAAMPGLLRDALVAERLGVTPSELLQGCRLFLVVEGEHDLTVLDSMFGSELDRCRVLVLPMRGARRALSVVDSRVLLDFTDAKILIVLDRLDMKVLGATWRRARELASQGRHDEARRLVETIGRSGRGSTSPTEAVIMRESARRPSRVA